jgi:hypothetical protein
MRKLILLAMICSFAAHLYAQQAQVQNTTRTDLPSTAPNKAYFPMGKRVMVLREGTNLNVKHRATLAKIQNNLVQIDTMANTYATASQANLQIACDPATNSVAICSRGNDRVVTTSVGNNLYVRYSSDHGATWTARGPNMSSTASPRYPQVFLFNPTQASSTSSVTSLLVWPQTIAYPGSTPASNWGDVDVMVSGFGNTSPSYSKWPTQAPNWEIPSQIVYGGGKVFSLCLGIQPANGTSTKEYSMLQSSDGKAWVQTNAASPAFALAQVPTTQEAFSICYDVSPDGTHMIIGYILAMPDNTGAWPYLSPDHAIAYVESTDGGATWSPNPIVVSLGNLPVIPGFLTANPALALVDLSVVYDANNEPHFLTCASGNINPYDPRSTAPQPNSIIIQYVDSTYMVEVARSGGTWTLNPIAQVHRPTVTRRSFSQQYTTSTGSTVEEYETLGHEPHWARSFDANKIYAKWIDVDSCLKFPYAFTDASGNFGIVLDTITNICVSGRHIGSKVAGGGWALPQEVTHGTDVGAKFSKMARFAGNGGELHMFFTQWGESDNSVDDDPVNSDCYLQYVQGVKVDAVLATDKPGQANDFTLAQNYPNPFNPSTSIRFSLPSNGPVKLKVFNLLGKEIATIFEGNLEAGTHTMSFNADQLASGIYTYRLEYAKQSLTKKMTVLK